MLSLSEIAFWSYVGGGLSLAPVMLAFVFFDHRPAPIAAIVIFMLHLVGWPVTIWFFRPERPFSISIGRKRSAGVSPSIARPFTH